MDKDTTTKIKLGFFVTVGMLILMIGIYSIGNRQNLFTRNFQLSTHFRQVSGLQPGNNVRFSGINVGTVEDIIILNDSTIEVVMIIKEQVQEFIKKDEKEAALQKSLNRYSILATKKIKLVDYEKRFSAKEMVSPVS